MYKKVFVFLIFGLFLTNLVFAKEDNYFLKAYDFYRKKDFKNAFFYCKKCLKSQPKNFDCNFLLARLYWEKAKTTASIRYLLRAGKIKPEDWRVWVSLGSIYRVRKNFKKAKFYFETALKYNPNSSIALIELAEIYFREKKYYQAIDFAKRGLTFDPYNYWGYYILGLAYLKIDNKEEALSACNSLREFDSKLADELLKKIKYKNFSAK